MKIGSKELIVTIIMVVTFSIITLNVVSLATGSQEPFIITPSNNKASNNNFSSLLNVIDERNNTEKNNTVAVNNTVQQENVVVNTPVANTKVNNTRANTNTGDMPDTGIEDAPWLIMLICAASAGFAYKKIKEYKLD